MTTSEAMIQQAQRLQRDVRVPEVADAYKRVFMVRRLLHMSIFCLHPDHRMNYELDLLESGHYYREYQRVMAHWQQLYGDDMITFDYDNLVRNPDSAGAELCAELGSPCDTYRLDFAQAARSVSAASGWRVREPRYQHSSGRAGHVAQQIGPLRDYLAGSHTAGATTP